MANPSTLVTKPQRAGTIAIIDVTSGAEVTLTILEDREYTLIHTGLDTDGTTASTGHVMLTVNGGTIGTDFTEGTDTYPLMDQRVVVIGPGVASLGLRALTADVAVAISAGPRLMLGH